MPQSPVRRLAVAPERDSAVPKLVDDPHCSLCDPGILRSFFSAPGIAHITSCLRSRMTSTRATCSSDSLSSRNPHLLTHGAPLPSRLEHPISCAVSSHHVRSHRICTMICRVDAWSCALGVRGQSVGLGHRCSSPAHARHRIQSPHPPRPLRLAVQLNVIRHHFSHPTRSSTRSM